MMISFRQAGRAWPMLFILLAFTACRMHKEAAFVCNTKTLIAEQNTDWLKYKVYVLPADTNRTGRHRSKEHLVLSIMVINMKDNTSPLRKLCTDLEDYNRYYEYLLNSCKNDIIVRTGKKDLYPVYYASENNYDAFPFESINVGFEYDLRKNGLNSLKKLQLVYTDKIFSHSTISCNLNYPKK